MNGKALILGDAGFIGTDLTKTNIYEPFMSRVQPQEKKCKKITDELADLWTGIIIQTRFLKLIFCVAKSFRHQFLKVLL